ncbi:MAG: ABC transporter permease [Xanthobacteraceae bacterium]
MSLSAATQRSTASPGAHARSFVGEMLAGRQGAIVRLGSLAITLSVWEWYGRGVDPVFFSYPTAILAAMPDMVRSGELQANFLASIQSMAIGLSLAVVFGTLLGLLMGRYRFFDQLLDVQISALYATPNVALVPLIILWFGLGLTAKVTIIFLAGFFPIVINTHAGVRNIGRGLIEVALAEAANQLQIFTKIVVPASLPFIATGIRLAMGRAVVAMVVAEMFTAVVGLGGAIVNYGNAFATDKLFVIIIVLALLGVSLTESVRWVERRIAPWKESERAD